MVPLEGNSFDISRERIERYSAWEGEHPGE